MSPNGPAPIFLPDPIERHHPLNRGRVAWWLTLPGIDGGRQWFDLLGLYPGVLTNITVGSGWRASARPGGRGHILFDGANDRVSVDALTTVPQSDFTVSVWTLRTLSTLGSTAVAWGNSANTTPFLLLGDASTTGAVSRVRWTNDAGTSTSIVGTATTNDGWHRLTATRIGNTLSLYVDGTPDGTPGSVSGTQTLDTLNIGALRSTTVGALWVGGIDDVSIWNRGLSAVEVRADYELSKFGYLGVLRRADWSPAWLPATVIAQASRTLAGATGAASASVVVTASVAATTGPIVVASSASVVALADAAITLGGVTAVSSAAAGAAAFASAILDGVSSSSSVGVAIGPVVIDRIDFTGAPADRIDFVEGR